MRNISLALLALSAAAVLYGCAEKKEAAETKGAGAPVAALSAPLPEQKEVAAAPSPEVKAVEEKAPAPAPAKTVKSVPAKASAPKVQAAAPSEVTAAAPKDVQAGVPKEVMAAAPKDVQAGMALYKAKCLPCHGSEGKGTTMAPALKGNAWIQAASNGDISEVILKGRQGKGKKYPNFFVDMPATRGVADSDVAAIIDYLRSLNN